MSNKDEKDISKKQRHLLEAGALLTVGAGAIIGGVTIPNMNVSAGRAALSDKRLVEDDTIKDIEHTSVDELNQLMLKGQSTSVKTQTGYVAKMMDELPSRTTLSSMYDGEDIDVSDSHTVYDIQQILAIKDADVYYHTSSLSQSNPQVMKMTDYRQMIKANPNVKVTPQANYQLVSPHLYDSRTKAYEDSANWKDSKVIESTRSKSLSFVSKTKPESMNFTADDGMVIGNMKIDTGFALNIKAEDGNALLTNEMQNDFEDAMEKNFSIRYDGISYFAVYHDQSISTDYGKNHADGYFTFATSTHGLPLEINGHYLVASVKFGSTIDSLKTSLSLHGVKSFENSDSWLNTEESNIGIKVNFVNQLEDEETTYYQIQAREQVIESLKYEYVTVSLDHEGLFESNDVYAAELSPEEQDAMSVSVESDTMDQVEEPVSITTNSPTDSEIDKSEENISKEDPVTQIATEQQTDVNSQDKQAGFSNISESDNTIQMVSENAKTDMIAVQTPNVSKQSKAVAVATTPTYSGSQASISPGGGVDANISDDSASLASWNQISTFSGGGYGNHIITVNSAVMTHSGEVTDYNFDAVLKMMQLSVDGTAFDQFVAAPIIVNGVQYAGYLTGSNGQGGSDFVIAVKDTNFNIYQIGGEFAYFSNITGNTAIPGAPEVTPPTDSGTGTPEVTPPTDSGTGTPEVTPPTDSGTGTPEVTPPTDSGTGTPEVTPPTDSGTGTPEVTPPTDSGTGTPEVTPPTDSGTGTPEVTPPTDPGTGTPEVTPPTDPGTGTPEVTPPTDPGTGTPEVTPPTDPSTGAPEVTPPTDPGTGTPEATTPTDPGTGTPEVTPPTDPGTGTPEVTPPTDPGTGTPEVTPPTDPGTGTPEVTPPTDPGTGTPEVTPPTDPSTGAPEVTPPTDPGTGTPEATTPTDPGTGTPEVTPPTDPGTGTPEVTPPTDPGTGTPEVTPPTDPGTGTPEVTPPTDPGTGTPEVTPPTDPSTGTPEVTPPTDPSTGTPEVTPPTDPGTGTPEATTPTDPGTGTPEVTPPTDPGTGTPEVTPPTDPGTGTPEVTPPTDPGTGTPEVTPPTDPSTGTPEVTPPTDPSTGTPEVTPPTDPGTGTPEVTPPTDPGTGLSEVTASTDLGVDISKGKDKLPYTGETTNMLGRIFGVLLIIFTGFIGIFKKRNQNIINEEDRIEKVLKDEDDEQEKRE
ncbi:hypothetical protein RV18_GL000708 [Enterococcus termitis]|nr:hypothetical protein RV18_GL000708 [Enterococcus termitis]